jgi:two-component system, sensor histidine kinase RegB
MLRWMAIAGQLLAILAATQIYGIQLPIGLSLFAVNIAIIGNLVLTFVFPANKRLSENESTLTLLFDLAQLAFLLFLTGGLSNPFALLILAPVTISASALSLRATLVVGGFAILSVTACALFNIPMEDPSGQTIRVPFLFEFGFWLSLIIGILFIALYSRRVSTEIHSMSDALLATQMALAREQKLTDLGGVIAAAAHELGTPLATIMMVSTEMIDELNESPDLKDDASLIRDQAARCRDILRSMGKAGKDDLHMRQAPLSAVLREAAEPHLNRGKEVFFSVQPSASANATEPEILRRPEIIHGLRNMVQNAVDFATSQVWIEATWSEKTLTIRIIDDGDGFAPQVLNRIGDPFLRSRREETAVGKRPGYEGMGLGLFIAKTLLERTGAELIFANATAPKDGAGIRSGAIVEAAWPLGAITTSSRSAFGENHPFQ